MHSNSTSQNITDAALATCLVAAPAWAGWVDQVNQLLTTLSLAIGLILAIARIWVWWRGAGKH